MKYLLYGIFTLLLTGIITGCKNGARFPIDETPVVRADHDFHGKWSAQEDKDRKNYFDIKWHDAYQYQGSYMNRRGTHAKYEHFPVFLSMINNTQFLNIGYWHKKEKGYFFLKVIRMNGTGKKFTAAVVSDTTLWHLSSSAKVRTRIAENIDNPHFYSDTLHFNKLEEY